MLMLLLFDALVHCENGKQIKLCSFAEREMIWFGVFVLLLPRTYPIFKYEYARVPSIHNLAQLCYPFVGTLLLRTIFLLRQTTFNILFGNLMFWPVCFSWCVRYNRISNTHQPTHTHTAMPDLEPIRPLHSNHFHPKFEVSIELWWIIVIIMKKVTVETMRTACL